MSIVLARPRAPRMPDSMVRIAAGIRGPWTLSQETLVILTAVYLSITANVTFFRVVAQTGAFAAGGGFGLAASLFVAITALNAFLLLVVTTRRSARPVLALILLVTSVAGYYMSRYTVYLDPDMIRNILHTDGKESGELLSAGLSAYVLVFGVAPASLLWRMKLKERPFNRAIWIRSIAIVSALTLATGATLWSFQPLASLMRNHHEVRYLIAPGNYLVSLGSVLGRSERHGPKRAVGLDAKVVGRPADAKPRLLVIVVGETVRAQNWGLNGYARQTTPQLARIPGLINFRDVDACGSSTEVSLPCMFSPYGRADYDAERIERNQGLLHVLEHAGIPTLWRDNQTGCKGVCEGLAFESFEHAAVPGECDAQGCFDGAMLDGLEALATRQPRDQVIVLHQLGNHGPAYYKRYPARFARFAPACASANLSDCSRQEIVNAYDNAILSTDDLLARVIRMLSAMPDRETAMLYVSDHGESLGEKGIYLHGMPFAIAPRTQTKVPMVLWLSERFTASRRIDARCLSQRAAQPSSHDNVFHSVLGLMQVEVTQRQPKLDFISRCAPGMSAR